MYKTTDKQRVKTSDQSRRKQRRSILLLCTTMLLGGTILGQTLRQNAFAAVSSEEHLTCTYTAPVGEGFAGYAVHVHNEDCFDWQGELVCPLPEIYPHVHSVDCYETRQVLICEQEESAGHQHTADCYTEVRSEPACGLQESEGHQHDESCYTELWGAPVCGLEETPGHMHTEFCLDEMGELICGMTEGEGAHMHDESCYLPTWELTCGLTEGEGAHFHDDSCYVFTLELTCGLSEGEGAHTHSANCYAAEQALICGQLELHTHTDDCFNAEGALVCGLPELEEHVHTADCFTSVTLSPEEAASHEMPNEANLEADLETETDWLPAFEGLARLGRGEDVAAVAKTQLGYHESEQNYILDDSGNCLRYSRYGAWYGTPYCDWNAAFTAFCLHYAGVDADRFPSFDDCAVWVDALAGLDIFTSGDDYVPQAGDLVFFDRDGDGLADSVAIVTDAGEDGVLHMIEGNVNGAVEEIRADRGTRRKSLVLAFSPPLRRPSRILMRLKFWTSQMKLTNLTQAMKLAKPTPPTILTRPTKPANPAKQTNPMRLTSRMKQISLPRKMRAKKSMTPTWTTRRVKASLRL